MLLLFFLTIITLLSVIITVAFFTLVERKVMASIQRRRGPSVVGFWGILQAFVDGLKLLLKEVIIPVRSNKFLFFFAPFLTLTISLLQWVILPLGHLNYVSNFSLSLLCTLALGSFGVYGIILAGWASNSRYAFIGSIRSTAQMLAYEVCLALTLFPLCILSNSFNFIELVEIQNNIWNLFTFFPLFFVFLITMLAETNRAPFDLPEAEAEIVAGYNVEYSSLTFALFFLGEYGNMLVNATVGAYLFLGGWLPLFETSFLGDAFWLFLKVMLFCFFFVLVRAALPRYRYDQLLAVGWKVLLPFIFSFFILFSSVLFTFG